MRTQERSSRWLSVLMGVGVLASTQAIGGVNRWTTNGPPDSVGSVKVDPVEPDTVYAGGGSGVWKRSGEGSAWESLGPEPDFSRVLAVSESGHVYAAGDTVIGNAFQGVLWTSADGGATWTVLRAGDFQTSYFVAVDPFELDAFFLIVNYSHGPVSTSGIERIGDSGSPWTTPEAGQGITFFSVVPDPVDEGTIYVTCNVGIFRTTDSGATWTLLNDSMRAVRTLVVDPSAPTLLYATIYAPPGEGGVYKSVDGGATFARSNAGIAVPDDAGSLALDAHHPGRLFVATLGGVFRSDDFGASWRSMNEGLIDQHVAEIALDPSGTFLHAATGDGVFDYTIATRERPIAVEGSRPVPRDLPERP